MAAQGFSSSFSETTGSVTWGSAFGSSVFVSGAEITGTSTLSASFLGCSTRFCDFRRGNFHSRRDCRSIYRADDGLCLLRRPRRDHARTVHNGFDLPMPRHIVFSKRKLDPISDLQRQAAGQIRIRAARFLHLNRAIVIHRAVVRFRVCNGLCGRMRTRLWSDPEDGIVVNTRLSRFSQFPSRHGFFSASSRQCCPNALLPAGSGKHSKHHSCNLPIYALSKSCDTNRSSFSAVKSSST